jgi:hypothetical protein
MVQHLKQILNRLGIVKRKKIEDPIVLIRRKRRFVTKLAYKYFTMEEAVEFDRLYNSKYVKDNKKVSNVVRLLMTKYKQERELWRRRTR